MTSTPSSPNLPPPPPPPPPPNVALSKVKGGIMAHPLVLASNGAPASACLRPARSRVGAFGQFVRPSPSEVALMSPTVAQRTLDTLRRHQLEQEERTRLRVPNEFLRVDVHDRQGVMQLCGCWAGVRLSTAQIKYCGIMSASLAQLFALTEEAYVLLTQEERRERPLPPLASGLGDFYSFASSWLHLYEGLVGFILGKQQELALLPSELPFVDTDGDEDEGSLGLLGSNGHEGSEGGASYAANGEGAPLVTPRSRYPEWLTVLIQRYAAERLSSVAPSSRPRVRPSPPPGVLAIDCLASFCAFLGPLLQSHGGAITDPERDCSSPRAALYTHTDRELHSLSVLVQASAVLTVPASAGPATRGYWARRAFSFLSTLPELRSVPGKDAERLESLLRSTCRPPPGNSSD